MKVDILGTEYSIVKRLNSKDEKLDDSDGYCDESIKLIVVEDFISDNRSLNDLNWYSNKVLRHEIIHAFLKESGLDCNSNDEWARNEEMIDYFAIQLPKIVKAMNELNIL